MSNLKLPSLSVSLAALEAKARRKKRRKARRGIEHPLEATRSGGAAKSRRKGSSFERLIAKLFEAYYGSRVARAPRSGGWATTAGFGARGDLVFRDRKAPYSVECKKQEGWNLADLLTGVRRMGKATNSIEAWWAQCDRDAKRSKRYPLLVFAKNGTPPLLMLKVAHLYELSDSNDTAPWWFQVPCTTLLVHAYSECEQPQRIVMLLSDFFKYVRPPQRSKRFKTWKRGVG